MLQMPATPQSRSSALLRLHQTFFPDSQLNSSNDDDGMMQRWARFHFSRNVGLLDTDFAAGVHCVLKRFCLSPGYPG